MKNTLPTTLIVALSAVGIGVSSYLTYSYVIDVQVVCFESAGCDLVKASPYAWVGPFPVPLLGLLAYVTLLALSVIKLRSAPASKAGLTLAIFGLALVGVLFSAYLTYLEAFEIRAFCYWCVTSAAVMGLIFVCSVLLLRSVEQNSHDP